MQACPSLDTRMGWELSVEEALGKLEASVLDEIMRYCADSGAPPSSAVVSETIEARRERSGPGIFQELYTEVEARVRARLKL